MDPASPTNERLSGGRNLVGYVTTAVGGAVGGGLGGWGGFQAGAWYGDRFIPDAVLQWHPVLLGMTAGASAGGVLVIWMGLLGFGLAPAGLTAVIFGAFVPAILAAIMLLGPGVEVPEILGTGIALLLLATVLSRAGGVRIARAGAVARRTGLAVIVSVWVLALGAVWALGT
jgi:hypothetical protein